MFFQRKRSEVTICKIKNSFPTKNDWLIARRLKTNIVKPRNDPVRVNLYAIQAGIGSEESNHGKTEQGKEKSTSDVNRPKGVFWTAVWGD